MCSVCVCCIFVALFYKLTLTKTNETAENEEEKCKQQITKMPGAAAIEI